MATRTSNILVLLPLSFLCVLVLTDQIPFITEASSGEWDPIPINQFAVKLRENIHPRTIAERHGIKFRTTMKTLPDVHIFDFPEHFLGSFAQNLLKELLHNENVLWAQQQVKKRHFKRTTDPLYSEQWHLHNNPHSDLNVEPAWENGFLGNGVLISIVDDGLDYHHPDIASAYVREASYDVNFQDTDPSPKSNEYHGSEAAGVAAARRFNGVCGVGVAPEARMAAVRLLSAETADWEEADGLQFRNDIVDVYSNSWGPYDDGRRLDGPGPLTLEAMQRSVEFGRGGKGVVYVWAAGNGGGSKDNCNYDGYSNSRFTIAIGAIGRNGTHVYYSEPCAALVASAPSSDTSGNSISTSGLNGLCKTNFGGTSASCPMVAGVVALCLGANPNLGWRDMQGVLIESIAPVDESSSDWVTNGAGHRVHHSYGFGRVDAHQATQVATTWVNFPNEESVSSGTIEVNGGIPDLGRGFYSTEWECTYDMTVEHVELIFDARHSARGQLLIVLISPSGTESILADLRNDVNPDYSYWKFMTIRNWGESSLGTWTLRVTDQVLGGIGVVNSFQINVFGHQPVLSATGNLH